MSNSDMLKLIAFTLGPALLLFSAWMTYRDRKAIPVDQRPFGKRLLVGLSYLGIAIIAASILLMIFGPDGFD